MANRQTVQQWGYAVGRYACHKYCLVSLDINIIQVKTTFRYHYTYWKVETKHDIKTITQALLKAMKMV